MRGQYVSISLLLLFVVFIIKASVFYYLLFLLVIGSVFIILYCSYSETEIALVVPELESSIKTESCDIFVKQQAVFLVLLLL